MQVNDCGDIIILIVHTEGIVCGLKVCPTKKVVIVEKLISERRGCWTSDRYKVAMEN